MTIRIAWAIALAMLIGSPAGAQQPTPAPSVKPFLDGAYWVLLEPLTYRMGDTDFRVTVPKGFVTDFASIPAPVRVLLSPTGQEGRAAIIHDYLYWTQACSREQADRILLLAMIETRVTLVTRYAVYGAVRAGGESAWRSNQAERQRGLPRIIPDAFMNIPALALWPGYREGLVTSGIRPEAGPASAPAYCAASETLNVVVP